MEASHRLAPLPGAERLVLRPGVLVLDAVLQPPTDGPEDALGFRVLRLSARFRVVDGVLPAPSSVDLEQGDRVEQLPRLPLSTALAQ